MRNTVAILRRRRRHNAGGQTITATVEPAGQELIVGDALSTIANFATITNTTNYASAEGTISSASVQVNGVAQIGSFTVSDGDAVVVVVTDTAANTRSWTIDGNVTYVAPTVNAAATTSGGAVAGATLTGTPATFNGGGITITNLWEDSPDGVEWTSTGNTTTTSPAQIEGEYMRFVSTGTNSGGFATSTTASVGPATAAGTGIGSMAIGSTFIVA